MTKTYKHTVLGREATLVMLGDQPCGYACKELGANILGNERAIEALGFIEAPTDTEEKRDWIDKVMNDMEHIKFHIDSRYCDWEQCKKEVRQSIEKHKPMPFDNEYYKQSVEQELVPLDVETIIQEITDSCGLRHYTKRLRNILSRYGVHKQEEKSSNTVAFIVDSYGNTPNPQATSVDVEEDKIETIVQDLRECMVTKPIGVRGGGIVSMVEIREIVKKHLSSLPIQKKRTREEIGNACNRDIKNDFANTNCDEYRSYVVVSKVMKSFGLLKD